MSQSDQPNHSNIIGEIFDAANISQPQSIPGSITPDNIQVPAPQPQTPPTQNGFTIDSLQVPAPTPEPTQEGSNE